LYLYNIKIHTDINQNGLEKIRGKITIFKYIYIYILNKAGLSPIAWAGLMFQPATTGLDSAGWAGVPARRKTCLVTVHEHSNQLIN
jgi:hypothetical protein